MNKKFLLFFIFIVLNSIKIIFFHSKISNINYSFIIYVFFLSFLIYFLLFNLKIRFFCLIFYILQFLYLSINLTYFLYFKIYLTAETFFSLFGHGLISVLKGAFPFYPSVLLFLIDLPFLLILLRKSNFKEVSKINKFLKIIFYTVSLIFLFFYIILNFSKIKEKDRIYDFTADFRIVEKFGPFFWQIDEYFKEKDFSSELKISKNLIEKKGKEKHFNLIFIQVESLDAYIIKEKFEDNYIMAYLNELKENSVHYPYVISYHYGGGTSDCEFSIFNSVEPLLGFPSINILNYDYKNSFLKILKKNDYSIKAFHGNEGYFWNRNFAFPGMGFDEYYDIKKMGLKQKGWGAEDKDVFEFMLKKLKEENKPFFYYIITMSSHIPFTNVLNYYKNEKFNKVEERVLRNYFLSMSYVDEVLKYYIKEFRKIPDTYIFIYGDHTGIVEQTPKGKSFIDLDGLKVEFVPLLIITPENKVFKEENLCGTFLDFAPTALSATGVEFKYFTDGQNLLDFPIENDKISPFYKKYDRKFLLTHIMFYK